MDKTVELGPFCPFLKISGQNSAVDGRLLFYSALFELCGRFLASWQHSCTLTVVNRYKHRVERVLSFLSSRPNRDSLIPLPAS
jgi:hypothetical protein